MKESLPKIDSSCNDTFRRISKVPTMPVLSRFTYTAYVLADSLFFSSTPGASSSRGRLQVGGVCKSGASARASSRRERLQVGNAFKSGASLRRHEQFNAACLQCCIFHSNGKKKSFFDFKLGDVFQYLFHHVYTLQTYLFISVKSQH